MIESNRFTNAKIRYEVLTELSTISAIAQEWNRLLDHSGCNLAFSSAEWFVGACRVQPEIRPYVILARRERKLAGIFPLVLTNGGSDARFLSYISDYNDMVVSQDDRDVADRLLDYALESSGDYRTLLLTNLRDDSHCIRAVRKSDCFSEASFHQDVTCSYLRIFSTYDQYLRTKSKVFRKGLSRATRAAERHNLRVEELDPCTFTPAQLADSFLSLNYKRFGSGSHLISESTQAFIWELFPKLFSQGRLRAFALYDANRIIAIDICMVGHNSLCTWNGGFVREAARWSPGRLLINAGIEKAYAQGMDEYDFLRGLHPYKASWANCTRVLNRCELRLRDQPLPAARTPFKLISQTHDGVVASTKTTATAEISYRILNDLSEIQTIAPEWNALLDRSKSICNPAFNSAQWFVASCRFVEAESPYVLVARRADTLVGIFPLVLTAEGTVAGFPEDESDYHDMVVAPEDVAVSTGLLLQALSPALGYRKLVLTRVREDSNTFRAARELSSRSTLKAKYCTDTTCPYIALPGSYDAYLMTRSKSFRTSLRQAEHQAERDGLRVCLLRPEDFPPADLPTVFLSLHLDRFANRSSLSTPAAQAFIRDILPSLFAEDRLLAFALYQAETIVALNLCLVSPNSLGLWNGGFSAAAERWSPGKLLIAAGIRQACARNMAEYDFLRGLEAYKWRWANGSRTIAEIEFKL